MAKKNKPINSAKPYAENKYAPQPQTTNEQKLKQPVNNNFIKRYGNVFIPVGIAIVTWLFLKISINNQLINRDDHGYILYNPLIQDISTEGLKKIFSTSIMGNYHPLTILTYAIEYSYAHFDAAVYHRDSVFIHILVTMLVYWFVTLLTKRPVAGMVTALFFGLHPMHVESVAWASSRKDLVYGTFYMAACIAYVYYVRANRKKILWYTSVVLMFICSLLGKPVAVILPVSLFLIDYFEQRKWNIWLLAEKLPLFAISIGFGIKSVIDQRAFGALDTNDIRYNFIERIALGCYAFVTYLWKAIVPAGLSCYYPYPLKTGGALPYIYYIYPVIAAVIIFLVWKFARKNRVVIFGSLFFVANITLLLQFIPVGGVINAERYTYIPYLGLFFVAGWFVAVFFEPGGNKQLGSVALVASLAYSMVLGYLSNDRCNVWYDSTSIWRDMIKKDLYRAPDALNYLGFEYFYKFNDAVNPTEKKRYRDSAYFLLNLSVLLNKGFAQPYVGLANIYAIEGKFDSSERYFRTALQLCPVFPEAHSNFGNYFAMTGHLDSARMQYSLAIQQDPRKYNFYLNRGQVLLQLYKPDEAMKDFEKALQLSPDNGEIYYSRSYCFLQNGNKPLALKDVEKAISLGFSRVDDKYYKSLKN